MCQTQKKSKELLEQYVWVLPRYLLLLRRKTWKYDIQPAGVRTDNSIIKKVLFNNLPLHNYVLSILSIPKILRMNLVFLILYDFSNFHPKMANFAGASTLMKSTLMSSAHNTINRSFHPLTFFMRGVRVEFYLSGKNLS